jgi:RHS repeat-associated protein
VTVTAPGQTTVAGSVFVAKNPETFGYDADGNMTNDGRWTYTWNGENRLVNMTSLTNAPTASQYKLDFLYDYLGRRIQKIVSTTTNSGTNYTAQYTNRFVYDGWNAVAMLNPASAVLASFVWGMDLSGSMQGAGGVGGLLTENIVSNGVSFVANDGNGNLTALVNAATGVVSANYEYGPFGEVIRATGPMAKVNPFLFSTKYYDWETGLYYYGCRYYNPSTGRWPSRDPREEDGGLDLYGFANNDAQNGYDILGLSDLAYSSQGETYVNPSAWLPGVTTTYSESGKQNSAEAFFSRTAHTSRKNGGLCDTSDRHSSSFVTASVKNTCNRGLGVSCSCTVGWLISDQAPYINGKVGKVGLSVRGTILFNTVSYNYDHPIKVGAYWVSSGGNSKTVQLGFFLAPGASQELFYVHPNISLPPIGDLSFSEEMSGSCACSAR